MTRIISIISLMISLCVFAHYTSPSLYSQTSASGKPVVEIADRLMSRENFNAKISRYEENLKREKAAGNKALQDPKKFQNSLVNYQEAIIEDWIDITLLTLEAQAQGIIVSEAEVDDGIAQLKQAEGDSFDLEKHLSIIGLAKKEFLSEMKDGIFGDKLIKKTLGEKYDDAAMKQFYEDHRMSFVVPEEARIERIVKLHYRRKSKDLMKKNLNIMKKLRKKAKKGASFEQIVNEYNIGVTSLVDRLRYYDITVLKGDNRTKLAEAAFKLRPGKVSNIIDTKSSLNIIKLIERKPATGMTFEDAREQVRAFLYNDVRGKLLQKVRRKHRINRYLIWERGKP